jgi:hypothetical protein
MAILEYLNFTIDQKKVEDELDLAMRRRGRCGIP